MDWIRAHYERVSVLAGAAILLLSALFLCRSATQFGNTFAARQAAPLPKAAAPPPEAREMEAASKKLELAQQWTFSGRSGLFVPEKHFIGTNGMPATLQNTQVHPPVPNEWFEQFNLPIADADVLDQDPDGDGFTNQDEWQGKTNPTDKNSKPEYYTRLRLKSFTEEPFRLMLSSWDKETFGINAIDLKEPTQFLKMGDTIKGTRFKLMKFTEKHQPNPTTGGDVDVSELLLEHELTHAQLTLIREKVAVSPESVATFTYSWPAGSAVETFQVRKDQEFSLKPQEQIKYKLIDVQPSKAVIVNLNRPNDQIQIGLAAP